MEVSLYEIVPPPTRWMHPIRFESDGPRRDELKQTGLVEECTLGVQK